MYNKYRKKCLEDLLNAMQILTEMSRGDTRLPPDTTHFDAVMAANDINAVIENMKLKSSPGELRLELAKSI